MLADALVAESVFQLAQGRPARAGANLDAIAGGEMPPPALEILRTPQAGPAITYRLLVLFSPGGEAPDGRPRQAACVRRRSRPECLGRAPARRSSTRAFQALHVDPATQETLLTRDVRLSELPLVPLDLLQLTQVADGHRYPDVEQLISHFLTRQRPTNVPRTAEVRLQLERQPDFTAGELALTELLDLAHTCGKLVPGARPLTDADLTPPDSLPVLTIDVAELRARRSRGGPPTRAARQSESDSRGRRRPRRIADILVRAALLGIPNAVSATRVGAGETR
jgi:hypothetical protein